MKFSQNRIARAFIRGLAALLLAGGPTAALAQATATPAAPADVARLQQRIAALEQKLKQLEQKLEGGATMKAPFTVLDENGNRLLHVSADDGGQLTFGGDVKAPAFHVRDSGDGVALLLNGISGRVLLSAGRDGAAQVEAASGGTTIARLTADADAGASAQVQQGTGVGGVSIEETLPRVHLSKGGKEFFVVNSKKETLLKLGDDAQPVFAVKGANGASSLELFDAQRLVARIGRGSGSNTVFRLLGKGNSDAVALGQDTQGNGALWVNYASGKRLASIFADTAGEPAVMVYSPASSVIAAMTMGFGGAGAFQIYSSGGEVLGSLTQAQHGGMLQLNTLSGIPMVEAGNTGTVGVVRAGPIIRTGGAMLGLPGSFIMGKRQ